MKVLILGVNGFIGSHLTDAILQNTDWQINSMDLMEDKIASHLQNSRFQFKRGDITKEKNWIEEAIQASDVVLPLVAIATPALYVQDPLRVFELDFEANLQIVRYCVAYQKRLVFPSTSEVYGMCGDKEFDEEMSHLVTGPINKERWIYSTSKQLLDRLIFAFGKHKNLAYTLFRPFNWYGPRLDDINNAKPGGSRVLTQFMGNILRGETIHLVNGGAQKRCFTYVDDGINALIKIIANENNCAHNKIFNIGNPFENISIRELAETIVHTVMKDFPQHAKLAQQVQLLNIDAKEYYGDGYQDVELRVPSISQARQFLAWEPTVPFQQGLGKTLHFYLT